MSVPSAHIVQFCGSATSIPSTVNKYVVLALSVGDDVYVERLDTASVLVFTHHLYDAAAHFTHTAFKEKLR